MKISVVIPDLSCAYGNCMSRGYLFAKILQRRYEVEMVGPLLGEGIWTPVASDSHMNYKGVDCRGITLKEGVKLSQKFKQVAEKIEGDVVYASKPLLTSFGIGLWVRAVEKKPVILDIDDWQMGFRKEAYRKKKLGQKIDDLKKSARQPHTTTSYWNNWIGEQLTGWANDITLSNRFLQQKFGGEVVRHAEDTDLFDPEKIDKKQARENLGIEEGKKIVMFCGSPRKHKGVEDLVEAISLVKNTDVVLAIVGNDAEWYSINFVKRAKEKLGDRFQAFGLQPFDRVPEFLATADLTVIPQQKNFATMGQMPIKVFDAMAMAKPIIASNVSDLPEVLEGCGWIVEPDNPQAIATAIEYVLDHPQEAEEAGHKARLKCVENYSWNAIEKVLVNLFQKYE